MGTTGGNVVDVQNHVREALVEHAGLNEERDLGLDEAGFDFAEGVQAARSEPEAHGGGEDGAEDGEDTDGNEHALAADAERGEGDDFAVHGHAAESEEDTDEDGHGDGEDENAGKDGEEESGNLCAGAGMADKNFH